MCSLLLSGDQITVSLHGVAAKTHTHITHTPGQSNHKNVSLSLFLASVTSSCRIRDIPHSPRYVVAIRVGKGKVDQTDLEATLPAWFQALQSGPTVAVEPLPWHDILLPELEVKSGSLAAYRVEQPAEARKSKAKKNEAGDEKVLAFEVEHMEAYVSAGLSYPPSFPNDFDAATHGYPRRLKELMYYMQQTQGPAHDMSDILLFRDVNMSMGYGSTLMRLCPCIASSSIIYCRGSYKSRLGEAVVIDRLLTGEECLSLQGFDIQKQRETKTGRRFDYTQHVDMAGNAFAAPCVMDALHEIFVIVPPRVLAGVEVPFLEECAEAEDGNENGGTPLEPMEDADSGHDSHGEVENEEDMEEEEEEEDDEDEEVEVPLPFGDDDANDVFFA